MKVFKDLIVVIVVATALVWALWQGILYVGTSRGLLKDQATPSTKTTSASPSVEYAPAGKTKMKILWGGPLDFLSVTDTNGNKTAQFQIGLREDGFTVWRRTK